MLYPCIILVHRPVLAGGGVTLWLRAWAGNHTTWAPFLTLPLTMGRLLNLSVSRFHLKRGMKTDQVVEIIPG